MMMRDGGRQTSVVARGVVVVAIVVVEEYESVSRVRGKEKMGGAGSGRLINNKSGRGGGRDDAASLGASTGGVGTWVHPTSHFANSWPKSQLTANESAC